MGRVLGAVWRFWGGDWKFFGAEWRIGEEWSGEESIPSSCHSNSGHRMIS